MAKQLNYDVRVYSPDGKVQNGSTYYGLVKAVALLSEATGQQWSYQIINRALRAGAGSLWASAYSGPDGPRICSIQAVSIFAPTIVHDAPGDPGRLRDVSKRTPLDLLIAQEAGEAELGRCHDCGVLHELIPGNCGWCANCIDAPPPLAVRM